MMMSKIFDTIPCVQKLIFTVNVSSTENETYANYRASHVYKTRNKSESVDISEEEARVCVCVKSVDGKGKSDVKIK
jgi:hypothetical protein